MAAGWPANFWVRYRRRSIGMIGAAFSIPLPCRRRALAELEPPVRLIRNGESGDEAREGTDA